MKDTLKKIFVVASIILFAIFLFAVIGVITLCVLFGNILGSIVLVIFSILLGLNIYIYYEEEFKNGE